MKLNIRGLPYDLVIDGVIQRDNLKKISKEEKWLKNQVEKFGFEPDEALIVTINGSGEIYCQKKEEK